MTTQLQYKRGTAARWASLNPVLAAGEPGWESDTFRSKVGDGTTAWNALPYVFDKATADGLYPAAGAVVLTNTKGVANGIATLDANVRVPAAQMPVDYPLMVPRWQPATVYAAGQQVVTPTNEIATSKTAHTSGTTFSGPTNWTLGSSLNAKGLIALMQTTSNTPQYGGGVNTVAAIPSVTFKAGRKYKISWQSEFQTTDGTLYAFVGIFKVPTTDLATSNVGMAQGNGTTEMESHTITAKGANLTEFFEFYTWYAPTVDETVQLKFATGGVAGAGNIYFLGRVGRPISYTVEDQGAQF